MLESRPTSIELRRKRVSARRRVVFAAGLLGAVGVAFAVSEALAVDRVWINEMAVPASQVADWADDEIDRWELAEVSLLIGDQVFRRTRRDLGGYLLRSELNEQLDRVLERDEAVERRVSWEPTVEHADLLRAVFELREETAQTTEVQGGARTEDRTLDLHASLKTVREALEASKLFVQLPMRSVARIRNTRDRTYLLEFSEMIARHRSKYRAVGRSWGRGHNIQKAAAALDGVIIEPRGELSFNEVVGERSFQRGFAPAPEIARGRVVEGIGGGVCQVATALHDASLHAAFEVLEHYVHSKRPRYAGRGHDSAVAWGLKDLRVRNPFDVPVLVKTYARAGTLELELWSGRRPMKVEITQEVVRGSVRQRDEALVIRRTRVIHWPDGPQTDVANLMYPAEPKDPPS